MPLQFVACKVIDNYHNLQQDILETFIDRGEGYAICLVFLQLFERIYAPLTAGLLQPFSGDGKLQQQKRTPLDRLYQRVADDLRIPVR